MNEDEATKYMVENNLSLSPIEIQAVQIADELGLNPEQVDYAMEEYDD